MEKILEWLNNNIPVVTGAAFAFCISLLTVREGSFRERRGVTDSEVARLTGVNQSTITRLRQGTQKKASADLYFRICAVFRSRFPADNPGASHD